jgi:hypothetical protein
VRRRWFVRDPDHEGFRVVGVLGLVRVVFVGLGVGGRERDGL